MDHPCFPFYKRKPRSKRMAISVMQDGVNKTLLIDATSYDKMIAIATTLKLQRHQRQCATRFIRRMRSIRAIRPSIVSL